LLLLWLLSHFLHVPAVHPHWLLAAFAFEQTLGAISFTRMTGRWVPPPALLVNPLRQWLTLGIWVLGWFVETVEWRGKAYRVGAGSLLRPATGPVPARVVER
jgi:hypothetical protein